VEVRREDGTRSEIVHSVRTVQAGCPPGLERIPAWERLDALVTRRYAPWAVVANENQLTLLSSRVRGYVFKHGLGGPDLAAMWLKR
jgi:hypothetical protein